MLRLANGGRRHVRAKIYSQVGRCIAGKTLAKIGTCGRGCCPRIDDPRRLKSFNIAVHSSDQPKRLLNVTLQNRKSRP